MSTISFAPEVTAEQRRKFMEYLYLLYKGAASGELPYEGDLNDLPNLKLRKADIVAFLKSKNIHDKFFNQMPIQ